jgi:integrase
MKIKVKTVKAGRDGIVFRWTDLAGRTRQRRYQGRKTRNRIEDARREIEDQLNAVGVDLKWSQFLEQVRTLYYYGLGRRAIDKAETMLSRFQAIHGDFWCSRLHKTHLLEVERQMVLSDLASATIASNMATIWAIVNWGIDQDMLPPIKRPRKRKRKADKAESVSGGRSLTGEEIDRMVDAIRNNAELDGKPLLKAGEDAESFVRSIYAARLMGLRVDDCHRLSFNNGLGRHVAYIDESAPVIAFCSDQKNGLEEDVPLTPQAVEWLRTVPSGLEWIARARGSRGWHKTTHRLCRVIAGAGRAARIVTKRNSRRTKYASAHDLRRTFAVEMLGRLSVKEVQKLTRHADCQILLRYYADVQQDTLSKKMAEVGGFSVGMCNSQVST